MARLFQCGCGTVPYRWRCPKSVQEGDATPAYEDNRVWVATKAEHQGVLQMSRKPAVLTPNGDEHNDVGRIGV